MRLFLRFTFSIFLFTCSTSAYDNTTISFDQNMIENRINSGEIKYSNYKSTAVSANLSLSAENYYIELLPNEKSQDVKLKIRKNEIIDHSQNTDIFEDYVTSSDDHYPTPERIAIGQDPLFIGDEIIINETRYARLRIFPVTIDTSGSIFFNESLTLIIGNRTILPSDLLSDDDISFIKSQYTKEKNQGFSNADVLEYVIITSSPLIEACEELADYKTSTGINTEVKIVEDILPLYSGRDDAEKLREYLKVFYADGGKYVLMAGDETILPIRYAYHGTSSTNVALDQLQIADLYFADINGDWNADGDNVWGERTVDDADLTSELYVGRLPFNTAVQMINYVNKLIAYETNPGNGDTDYLERTFFFCSDQMRDYPDGQHGFIAQTFPGYFEVDSTEGVETPTGSDNYPTNSSAYDLTDHISDGFGIVHIIAHGRPDAFGVWTTGYNNWPKSYFITGQASSTHGSFLNLTNNNKVSMYYSLACSNGSFDQDIGNYGDNGYLIVSELLSLPGAGAVGFVANSRWGWVGSSYYLQYTYFNSLFANPEQPAVEAMYECKEMYYYYRDLVLGQNFHGDPTLKIYTSKPETQEITVVFGSEKKVTVISNSQPVDNSHIVISLDGAIIDEGYTNQNGEFSLPDGLLYGIEYSIASVKSGYTTSLGKFTPSLTTDIDEENDILPGTFTLYQNYPNPFNPTTLIEFDIPVKTIVEINIYNSLGQNIVTLMNDQVQAGSHTIEWNGNNKNNSAVSSGIYFYKLTSEDYTDTKRMILLR